MRDHKVCRNCKHNISSTWLQSKECEKCKGFSMFERKENNMTIEEAKNFSSTSMPKSVFETYKEADEALARKYGNRKEYNKMNNKIIVKVGGKYFRPISNEAEFSQREYPRYKVEVEINPTYMIAETASPNTLIKKVIFNPPATIVFWADNSKTVVKSQNDEPFDPEKGLAMAIAKKAYGNKRDYYNTFIKWTKKYKPTKSDDECQTK